MTEHFTKLGPLTRPIAERLHAILMKFEPDFAVVRAWGGVGYKLGNNYSGLIVDYRNHVKLMIWLGTELADPEGVLEGSGGNTRHIRFDELSDVRAKVITRLLREQHALFAEGVRYERASKTRGPLPVPAFLEDAVKARGVLAAFRARPPYQRRDYITWITSAKRPETLERRASQMLAELDAGDVYMKMPWSDGA